MEALKAEGNALFQQGRFEEAVEVYSSVLMQLQESMARNDAALALETAVRLNRAWAWIQKPGCTVESDLIAAESDCSVVIERDPSCVKAFYRRALARERRGHWKLAMQDALAMQRLEPRNPSVGPLIERLQRLTQDEEELAPMLSQCTINGNEAVKKVDRIETMHNEAEEAWRALQADEMNLQRVHSSTVKSKRKPRNDKKVTQQNLPVNGDIFQKTDDLWASLRREETTIISKAFARKTGREQG